VGKSTKTEVKPLKDKKNRVWIHYVISVAVLLIFGLGMYAGYNLAINYNEAIKSQANKQVVVHQKELTDLVKALK